MTKEKLECMLERMLSSGADFAEVFVEERKTKVYNFIDSKLDSFNINYLNGIGLRIANKDKVYYASTNDLTLKNINSIIDKLKENIKEKRVFSYVELERLKSYKKSNKTHYTNEDIIALFKKIDKTLRDKDERINQVGITLTNIFQNVKVARENGLHVEDERVRTRIFITVSFKDKEKTCNNSYSYGLSESIDMLDKIDFEKEMENLVKEGLDKLYAEECVGMEMPVIIENGFGGVIFHEACGHAMEATSVADGLSVLSNDLNKVVASKVVNIVDDGTLDNEWGSLNVDDEGNETKKNVLIKDGVLKGFLIDEVNSKKMKMGITGSGRRESYLYAPTSRMNNTYLENGTSSFEDMIKDIKLGLYAKKMGGGCVSPETGDFNFACDLAYMIRDGKVAECVKSASLIGNCKEILKNVEMVGNNLALGQGMCGSVSGYVPVNVGMPRIRVSKILVGGKKTHE